MLLECVYACMFLSENLILNKMYAEYPQAG